MNAEKVAVNYRCRCRCLTYIEFIIYFMSRVYMFYYMWAGWWLQEEFSENLSFLAGGNESGEDQEVLTTDAFPKTCSSTELLYNVPAALEGAFCQDWTKSLKCHWLCVGTPHYTEMLGRKQEMRGFEKCQWSGLSNKLLKSHLQESQSFGACTQLATRSHCIFILWLILVLFLLQTFLHFFSLFHRF